MTFPSRPLKSKKPQLKCATCMEACAPKNGDWHSAKDGSQRFLCRACESKASSSSRASARA